LITTREQYTAAVADVSKAAAAYYTFGDSPLDDPTYDALVQDIAACERAHPDWVVAASPTGKIAGGAVTGDVPHTVPMLSLDNVFSSDGLATWAAGVERRIGHPVTQWTAELKLDGLAIAARYRGGRLVQLVTRGNGTAGEDVSHAIGTIEGLPLTLPSAMSLEVRGEVLMTQDQFTHANAVRAAHGEPAFAAARSGAAGTLRARERAYTLPMTFFAYGTAPAGEHDMFTERADTLPYADLIDELSAVGFSTTAATPLPLRRCAGLADMVAFIEQVTTNRPNLPFNIDGIVFKTGLPADQQAAGAGSRAPRWAIAYKLPAIERITVLQDVTWAVGRTGVIAPRAVLEPVEIDGVVVTFASLHNPSDIARRGLRIGDHVTVVRAGDVIPRVIAPATHLRTGQETPIVFPDRCPNCASEIDTSQQRWRCVRGRQCRLPPSIKYAVGRDQLDIEGIGSKLVTQLVDNALVADIADLFTLTSEDLLGLDRMGVTSVTKLLAAIETAKARPLSRVLCALGIAGTGRAMSRRMARHFGSMTVLQAADPETLAQVEGIGAEKTPVILAELAELAPVIAKLRAAGVNLTEPGALPQEPGAVTRAPGDGQAPLAGLTVVVTGTMSGPLAAYSRNEMNELVEKAGGKASGSVSSKTSLVVAGEGAGSKRAKAIALAIPVITPEEFAERVSAP
jgi:DNA ligase (NAD+)